MPSSFRVRQNGRQKKEFSTLNVCLTKNKHFDKQTFAATRKVFLPKNSAVPQKFQR